jgi:hypothetical protein
MTLTADDKRFLRSLRIKVEDEPTHKAHCQGDGCDCGDTDHAEAP